MPFDYKNSQLWFWDQDLQLTSKVYGIFYTTVTATYTSIAAGASQTQTVTLRGLRPVTGTGTAPNLNPGDYVQVDPTAALPAGVSIAAVWVSAANTVSIQLTTSTTQTPGAVIFSVFIMKFGQLDGLTS